jgi:glycosyltransferase involved in cell wall biosynthesis
MVKSPSLSVFTPSHNARFLDDCYQSLRGQTVENWEWVVLLNRGAKDWRPSKPDTRVQVFREDRLRGVGAAKRAACEHCTGDILVELDHDDVLAPTCLAEVHDAFVANPRSTFVHSDWAQVNEDLTRNEDRFQADNGWEYSEVQLLGTSYLRCHAMADYPHNVGYIWFAPNHVRAFPRSVYDQVGGYDERLQVLDDQDLMIRLFLVGDFHHLDDCLYLQRLHGRNTQVEPATNALIQQETVRLYEKNISVMSAAWSRRRGLGVITVRTATSPDDPDEDPGDVVVIDPLSPRLGLADDSVGLIKAPELLQRLPDRAAFFNECYRVLVHGGMILTETPSTDGRGAFQDPAHVSFYNENSFWYLTQSALRSSLPDLRARLQVSFLRTHFPSPWHEEVHVPYVQANLLAVKDGPRLGGPLLA